jgi:hypothetical protein
VRSILMSRDKVEGFKIPLPCRGGARGGFDDLENSPEGATSLSRRRKPPVQARPNKQSPARGDIDGSQGKCMFIIRAESHNGVIRTSFKTLNDS